ncbi:MAG: hypothetical protein HZC48_05020 [Nitrospirae bacterium]|nr:hypothetical protein [Nitrospirota bacterium]
MNTATKEINDISEVLPELPVDALREIRDFAFYLANREQRRRKFVKEVRRAEQERPIKFKSVEDAMAAIRNEAGI